MLLMNFGLCLRSVFVSPAPSSGQQWNKSCSIEAQAPNTLALAPLFRVMFDFYGYFQWMDIIWGMELRTLAYYRS